MDDHSRFVSGLDVFRSPPSAFVVEVYRKAVAVYGAPKEMLTDNGRQYTTGGARPALSRSWRKSASNPACGGTPGRTTR